MPHVDLKDVDFIEVGHYLNSFLRNGGSNDMAVDGDPTPVDFSLTAPAGFDYFVHRINFAIVTTAVVNADKFGDLGSGLTNGLRLFVTDADDRELFDLFDGEPVKTNGQFASFAGVDVRTLSGSKGVGIRWTFSKATDSAPIKIPSGWSLVAKVQDDVASLVTFTITAQGLRVGTES